MKKIFLVLLVSALLIFSGFAVRLGVQAQTYSGVVFGQWISGAQVTNTAPGYPAYNALFPGDIITEALIIPNSQIWMSGGMPGQGGAVFSFTPFYSLNAQIYVFGQYGMQPMYYQISSYQALSSVIGYAPYNSNVILRIFRPQWNAWTLVSIVLDSQGGGNIWMMQQVPAQQLPGGGVFVPNNPQFNPQNNPNAFIKIWIHF